jgi:hypothetical protein
MSIKQALLTALALTLPVSGTMAQNLVVNGDFEAGNSGFSNDYLYSPANMDPAGTYCVVTNPAAVHGSWSSFGDHTTGTGLMLVANGGPEPTNVVWRQTVAVSTNTTYLFSGWAASAHEASPGSFFLFVNGSQQGSAVTLPSETGRWQNYSVVWSSSSSVSALLEIRMLNADGYGNDFVLDDLSFRPVTSDTPSPQLAIQRAAGEPAVVLSWPSVANQLYQLQWAPTLATNQWFSLGAPVTGTGNPILRTNAMAGNPERFYRVIPVN